MPEFRLLEGGIQDMFLRSRAKIQVYAGGFGNGKTTGVVMKTLQIANDYPGANILMARATYPKLNDTLRREWLKWCPKDWIESFPISVNSSNTCTLTNGTQINFRYIAQQGKSEQATTSNLLSATFDLVVVDQMEDPEITHKDFLDLIGRLRGNAPYRGNDASMPSTGPRWFFITLNPTRNWVYKRVIAPYHLYIKSGIITSDLLCVRDPVTNEPIVDEDGKVMLMIELVEGGTDANAHNLPADFIQTMSSAYTGTMKARFLKGEWAAYEGLIYPQFNQMIHMVSEYDIRKYMDWLDKKNFELEWLEGYDYGLASPSCYGIGFVDHCGNVIVCDGFYQKEYPLEQQTNHIHRLRRKWGGESISVLCDPDIFRRKGARGECISDKFWLDASIQVTRAANDITSGIAKISGYLLPREGHTNPFTLDSPAPSVYFNDNLTWFSDEFGTYFWKKASSGEQIDTPATSEDHAMDMLKYMFTNRPTTAKIRPRDPRAPPAYLSWHEQDAMQQHKARRHGR